MGYIGRFCENDIDVCIFNGNLCFMGVNCIDKFVLVNIIGFSCGFCLFGYFGDGFECIGKFCMIMVWVMNFGM